MPATPEEMKRLVDAFERAHAPLARALADLFTRGSDILEEHRLVDSSVVPDFKSLILKIAEERCVSEQDLSAAVSDLRRLHVTVEQLERLP